MEGIYNQKLHDSYLLELHRLLLRVRLCFAYGKRHDSVSKYARCIFHACVLIEIYPAIFLGVQSCQNPHDARRNRPTRARALRSPGSAGG